MQSAHFFIDDPVSSLDDHNIYVTAYTVFDLIEREFENRKIIITSHHFGFLTILSDMLGKGKEQINSEIGMGQKSTKNLFLKARVTICR
jgi:DNA repair exonuclease SbcCD ATPase subunit